MAWQREAEYLVQVRWLTIDQGGRSSGAPQLTQEPDSEYRSVWVAEDQQAWTFALHRTGEAEPADHYEAVVPFAENGAPTLATGDKIALFEGPRRVAEVQVLSRLTPSA